MPLDFKQMDAYVSGSTVVFDESQQEIQTTELASVESESSVDTVLGVKDGVVVQVTPDDLASAETLQYTSWTENGITYKVCRIGNIAEVTAESGTLTSAFAADTVFANIPSGYRPRYINPRAWDVSRSARLMISTGGQVFSAVNLTVGDLIRFTAIYICQ